MPLSAKLGPRLPLPAGKQGPVLPPALSCIPSCRLHGKPHTQKRTTGPAMCCCSCPGSSWALGGNSLVYGLKKELRAKGKVISSLEILAYFGKLHSCTFCYCVIYCVMQCRGDSHLSSTWSGFFFIWKRKQIQNWEIWKCAPTFVIEIWEVKRKDNTKWQIHQVLDRTTCGAPLPWRGSWWMPLYPFAVHNQAMKPRNREVEMSRNLEIGLQGLRGQSSLEMRQGQ